MDTNLTDEEYELLELIAEAFSARELVKPDHPLTPMLVRKGVVRTNGSYVMLTGGGVATLRARGHSGPLPIARAARLTSPQRKPRPNPHRPDTEDDAEVR